MRIKQTSSAITAGIIVLSVLAIACALAARSYRRQQEQDSDTRRKLFTIAAQLTLGTDRLVAAVRAFAATGDRRYYDAFLRELTVDRNRDRSVEGLRQLGLTPAELGLLARVKPDADKLLALDNQVFAAMASRQSTRAIQIAYGPAYEATKAALLGNLAGCLRAIESRLAAQAAGATARARLLTNIALFTLALNSVAMAAALLLFYRRRVVYPLTSLNESLCGLVARKSDTRLGYQDDTSEVGELARSLESYRITVNHAEQQRWVKTSVAEIAHALQGAEQPEDFGRRLLSKLVPLTGGGYGAFHLFDESDGCFHCCSTYGSESRQSSGRSFAAGEGIAGQAAVERRTIVLSDLPANYLKKIGSGLGEAPPRAVVAVPITTPDRVLAVVEIASFRALTEPQRALLDEAADLVGLNLEILQRNLKIRALLEQTRQQAGALATQGQELAAAKQKAEEAAHVKSMFFTNMSREISTPMSAARLKGARILLVEDNEINQQIAVELITGVGASVTVSDSGREAVAHLLAGPTAYDLVLMDLQMPEMDGYQATAKIRSDERWAKLPIIAMAAHATLEEKQRCLAAGMNDLVAKSMDPGALIETVAHYYQPSAASETPPEPAPTSAPPGTPRRRTRARTQSAVAPVVAAELVSEAGFVAALSAPVPAPETSAISSGPMPESAPDAHSSIEGQGSPSLPGAGVPEGRQGLSPGPADVPETGESRSLSQRESAGVRADSFDHGMATPEPALEPSSISEPEPVPSPAAEEAAPTPLAPPPAAVPEEAQPDATAVAEVESVPATPASKSEALESPGSGTESAPETKATKAPRRKKVLREELPDLFAAVATPAPTPGEPPTPALSPDPAIMAHEEPEAPATPPPSARGKLELPPAAKEAEVELPVVEGLNAKDGLMRVAGNRKLYLKLLRQFATEQATAAEEIRDALVRGQSAVAERLAHTVKGVAGNLGAATVQAAAAAVERAIHSQVDPAEIELLWSELEQTLSALLAELKLCLQTKADPSAPQPPPPVNPAQLRKTMREMLPLLTDADPGAAECLEASRDVFRSAFTAEAFAEFERLVQSSTFNDALELLKKAAKKHGLSL